MNIYWKIPFTNYVFSVIISKTNPIWVRIYYKYRPEDAVLGIKGEIPNSEYQALGLDFDDELTLPFLEEHIRKLKTFVNYKWGLDLGRAWIYETSPNKYYVWFFESRLNYRCSCPTIINIAGIEGLKADPNFLMWLQKKDSCVMRISPKKFYKRKPRLVKIIGLRNHIPLDQELWINDLENLIGDGNVGK